MIKLLTESLFTYKDFEARVNAIRSLDELREFYRDFISNYKELDGRYRFTEALDEDFIFYQIEHQFQKRNTSLFGMPFGVKDIFNTRVLPTSMGSEIWKGFKAGNNARIVDEIYDRGGIIFSKTTTAEFAVHFITPEKTLNPFNKDHITGTSSSGSAVAVACGALPIALGTQTAGSIIRPASFCGVYGFKPSFGAIDRTGVLKTNDTLDTIGLMGSDIYGLRKVFFEVLQKGKDYPFSENYFHFHERYKAKDKSKLKIGVVTDAFNSYQHYDKIVRKDFESVVDQLDKSFRLKKTERRRLH